jgi:hypothetical protein
MPLLTTHSEELREMSRTECLLPVLLRGDKLVHVYKNSNYYQFDVLRGGESGGHLPPQTLITLNLFKI